MKPFNLEQAKAGEPVVNRSGQPVRIVCWDLRGSGPILAIHNQGSFESTFAHFENGKANMSMESFDLFMEEPEPPKPRQWWIGVDRYEQEYLHGGDSYPDWWQDAMKTIIRVREVIE